MKKLILFLFTITCLLFNTLAQDTHLIDSLSAKLKSLEAVKTELRHGATTINDTTTVNFLFELSKAYWSYNPDKGMVYARQSLSLAEQIGYKKGIGNAYHSMGNLIKASGNYMQALEFYRKSLAVRTEMNDRVGIAKSNINIGIVYTDQGNLTEGLKFQLIALKTFEATNDKKGIAAANNNIGSVYRDQNNYTEALKSFFNALKINKETGNKQWQAYNLLNIGLIYFSQNNNTEALKYYLAAATIAEELGDNNTLAGTYLNRGEVYTRLNNPEEALKDILEALKFFTETGNKLGIAACYIALGESYTNQKKYKEASENLNKALALSTEIGHLDNIIDSYKKFVKLDSAQGNFSKAFEHYKLLIATRDSLVNTESTKKTMQMQMNYDFNKKQVADSVKASVEKKVITAELKQEQTKSYALYCGLAFMLIVSGIFFKQRNKIGKEKKRSEDLLLNILPIEVAEELKSTGVSKAKTFSMVTVMFTDFKDFTSISEKVSGELLVDEINHCFSAFDTILAKHKVEKIKTIGDAYMAASGLPVLNYTHAADMIHAAIEIRNFMTTRKQEKESRGEIPFQIRIGIHTGPVVAGIVGVRKFQYDIWGDTVNLAARMESSGEVGKLNISGTTYELIKDKFNCVHRGKVTAKGKGEIDMYFVEV